MTSKAARSPDSRAVRTIDELGAEPPGRGQGVSSHNRVGAGFRMTRNIIETLDTSTHSIASFQDPDVKALFLEDPCRVETGHTGTNDNDIRRGLSPNNSGSGECQRDRRRRQEVNGVDPTKELQSAQAGNHGGGMAVTTAAASRAAGTSPNITPTMIQARHDGGRASKI